MTGKQRKMLVLAVREQAARILADAVEGHRQDLPIDPSQLSRYCTGECMSALGYVLLFVHLLPEPRAASLLSAVEDAYTDAHGADDTPALPDALVTAAESDSRQDVARAMAAVEDATDTDLHRLISDSYAQDHDTAIVRRAARAELAQRSGRPTYRRRLVRPAAVRRREARVS